MRWCQIHIVLPLARTGRKEVDGAPSAVRELRAKDDRFDTPQGAGDPNAWGEIFLHLGEPDPNSFQVPYNGDGHCFASPKDPLACHLWDGISGSANCPAASTCPYRGHLLRRTTSPLDGVHPRNLSSTKDGTRLLQVTKTKKRIGPEFHGDSLLKDTELRDLLVSAPPIAVPDPEDIAYDILAVTLRAALFNRKGPRRGDLLAWLGDTPGLRELHALGWWKHFDLWEYRDGADLRFRVFPVQLPNASASQDPLVQVWRRCLPFFHPPDEVHPEETRPPNQHSIWGEIWDWLLCKAKHRFKQAEELGIHVFLREPVASLPTDSKYNEYPPCNGYLQFRPDWTLGIALPASGDELLNIEKEHCTYVDGVDVAYFWERLHRRVFAWLPPYLRWAYRNRCNPVTVDQLIAWLAPLREVPLQGPPVPATKEPVVPNEAFAEVLSYATVHDQVLVIDDLLGSKTPSRFVPGRSRVQKVAAGQHSPPRRWGWFFRELPPIERCATPL